MAAVRGKEQCERLRRVVGQELDGVGGGNGSVGTVNPVRQALVERLRRKHIVLSKHCRRVPGVF